MDAKQKTLALLATVDDIDLDAVAETTLYTCPAGMVCYVTSVVMRKPAGAGLPMSTIEASFGWNTGNADNVIANAGRDLTDGTNYLIIGAIDDAVYGVAAGTFKIDVQVAEGAALTCSVDVFGYLVPA